MRSARARDPVASIGRERRLDHGFGFRPRHQRRGVERSGRPQNSLHADDAGHRLAREPARRERRDRVCLFGGEHPLGRRHEPGMIQPERMADQYARIEFGRVEAGDARNAWQARGAFVRPMRRDPSRNRDGRRCAVGDCHHAAGSSAASSAAWCSATSASMISPSASPSMICGSL